MSMRITGRHRERPPHDIRMAIMTDTDNTGETATAYFGDIRFEKKRLTP